MRRAVDNKEVMALGHFERAPNGAETLDSDFWLNAGLDAVPMPMESRGLADVQIGDLHIPTIGRKGTSDKPADGALARSAFL
jgi:hypothetical protein